MMEMEDPFDYQKPDWLIEKEREKRREARAKKLGRPVGKWGGYRKGSGKKRKREFDFMVGIDVTRIQQKILEDMGQGSLQQGIQALINEHC